MGYMCSECLKREDGYMHRDGAVDEYIYDHDVDVDIDVDEYGFSLEHEYTCQNRIYVQSVMAIGQCACNRVA